MATKPSSKPLNGDGVNLSIKLAGMATDMILDGENDTP